MWPPSVPYDVSAGTWSGDLFLNTNVSFGLNGAGDYDLFAVALHEAAHVLGIPHRHEGASPVYATYQGSISGDVAAVQAISGTRRSDQYEGATGNGERSSATDMIAGFYRGLEADITTLDDVDVYRYTAPTGAARLHFHLTAGGISTLMARFTLRDATGTVPQTVQARDPLTNHLMLDVPVTEPGSVFYVEVASGVDDVFGVGSYYLAPYASGADGAALPRTVGLTGPVAVQFIGDTRLDGQFLVGLQQAYGSRTPGDTAAAALDLTYPIAQIFGANDVYAYGSVLTPRQSTDYYRLTVPDLTPRHAGTMTVHAYDLHTGVRAPTIRVFDALGQPVAAEIIPVDRDAYVVQVAGVVPGQEFVFEVTPSDPLGSRADIYLLVVDFNFEPVQPRFTSDVVLGTAQPLVVRTYEAKQTEIAHFGVAPFGAATADAQVRLRVLDQRGHAVVEESGPANRPLSLIPLLSPGVYQLQVELLEPSRVGADLSLRLTVDVVSDPVGPYALDTTQTPSNAGSVAMVRTLLAGSQPAHGPALQAPVGAPCWVGALRGPVEVSSRPQSASAARSGGTGGTDGPGRIASYSSTTEPATWPDDPSLPFEALSPEGIAASEHARTTADQPAVTHAPLGAAAPSPVLENRAGALGEPRSMFGLAVTSILSVAALWFVKKPVTVLRQLSPLKWRPRRLPAKVQRHQRTPAATP